MKKQLFLFVLVLTSLAGHAQITAPKEKPQLDFVMQLRVTLVEVYSLGETPNDSPYA